MNITVIPHAFPLWCAEVEDQTIRSTGPVIGWMTGHPSYPDGEVEDYLVEMHEIQDSLNAEPVVAREDSGEGHEYKMTMVVRFRPGAD